VSAALVRVSQRHATLIVSAPYDPRFVVGAKKLGGRWDPAARVWSVPLAERAQLRTLLVEVYKTDAGLPAEAAPAVTTRPATALPSAADVDRIVAAYVLPGAAR
jgi:hypothetical protein